jgi:3-hydroxyisobutyrate dehydrogenase-like beta-hydroxyacid dehydrogenase
MATAVGFIGLGRIGKPIAANILASAFDVIVYDTREKPVRELGALGAKQANGLRALGECADIVVLAVVDDTQVEEILYKGGLLQACKRDTIIVIHSTITPGTIRKLARLGEEKGIKFLDATVSGGEDGARARQLCFMVGGEREVFDRVKPVLAASASNIFYLGNLGSGATAKLILQVVVCINMLGAYEAEILCEKLGLDFKSFQAVLRVSSGENFVTDHWFERFKRPHDPLPVRRRRAEVFAESLLPALGVARELEIELAGASVAHRHLSRVMGLDNSGES